MGFPFFPGDYPKTSIVISFSITAILLGIAIVYRPLVVLEFDHGYTTDNAPSIKGYASQMDFFGNQGTPWYMALFAEPKYENGSMVETDEFDEFKGFYKKIKSNMTIRTEIIDDSSVNLTYMNYCGQMCNFNDVIFKTFNMAWFGLDWPVTTIFSFNSNIGKYFFKRDMEGEKIKSAKVTVLYFMVFINSTEMQSDMREFERLVSIEVEKHNSNPNTITILTQHGARGMELEIKRGTELTSSRVLTGLIIFLLLTLVSLIIVNKVNNRCTGRFIVLGVVIIAIPIMSIVCTIGIFGLTTWHVNTLIFLSPVLLFPYALVNCLQFYNSWLIQSGRRGDSDSIALSETASLGGTFILTNASISVVLIIFGIFYNIPELGNLLKFMGFAIFFIHIHLFLLFAPCSVYCSPIVTHKKLITTPGCSEQCNSEKWNDIIDYYCKLIRKHKSLFLILGSAAGIGILAASCYGVTKTHGNLDYRHLLPPDSPNNKGVHLMSDVVWPDFLHILFIIEQPPNFSNPQEFQEFKKFIGQVQQLPGAIGPKSDMVWIFDFERYTEAPANATSLDMTKFKSFITHDVYGAWSSGVQYHMEGDIPIITRMLYMVGIEGTTSMADKAELMKNCRKVADAYPQFQAIPFDTEVGMADVITEIPYALAQIPIVMFIAQAATMISRKWLLESIVFQGFPYAAAILIAAIFGMTLNPFSVAFGLFIAVLSSVIHRNIVLYFVHSEAKGKKRRAKDCLKQTWLPSILSIIVSTSIFWPLFFCPIVIFYNLAIINILFMIISLIFILFIMPIALITFTGIDC